MTYRHGIRLLSIGFIILLSVFLRFVYLGEVPNAISGDELTYALNAQSLAFSGTDVTGTWKPLSAFLFKTPVGEGQAELPYFLISPFSRLTSNNFLNARISNALLSVGIVILVMLVANSILGYKIAIISGFIAAINPWFIYIGRTSFENVPAVFFYLFGTYLLLIKNKRIFMAIIMYILGFYSYIGMKVVFLPVIITTILYDRSIKQIKNFKIDKLYIYLLIISFIFFLFYISQVFRLSENRISELASPFSSEISGIVDSQRKASIVSPLTRIFINKPMMYLRIMNEKFFRSVSMEYLFATGDQFFSIYKHGLFYPIDIVFMIFGIIYLWIRKKRVLYFIFAMLFIGIIPHMIYTLKSDPFTPHIAWMFPFYIILIGSGISFVIDFFKNDRLKTLVYIIIFLCYSFLLLRFSQIYFFEQPLEGYFDYPKRIVSEYISRTADQKLKVKIYSNRADDIFRKYLFYSNAVQKGNLSDIRNVFKSHSIEFGNINFLGCYDNIDTKNIQEIIIIDSQCGYIPKDVSNIRIQIVKTGADTYRIYNDRLCQKENLNIWPAIPRLSDFNLNKLSDGDFCRTFFVR